MEVYEFYPYYAATYHHPQFYSKNSSYIQVIDHIQVHNNCLSRKRVIAFQKRERERENNLLGIKQCRIEAELNCNFDTNYEFQFDGLFQYIVQNWYFISMSNSFFFSQVCAQTAYL